MSNEEICPGANVSEEVAVDGGGSVLLEDEQALVLDCQPAVWSVSNDLILDIVCVG